MAAYVIAELGCNHCGSVEKALEMVDVAADCGVDAVKIQIRDLSLAPPDWADRVYVGPHSYGATYLDHRKALELDLGEYKEIVLASHARGIEIGASLWDSGGFAMAFECGVDWLKVPSAMLTNDVILGQLQWAAQYKGVPAYISTGMSTGEEVRHAVRDFDWPKGMLTLFMCTASYPCDNEQINLRRLRTLQELYGDVAEIGVSGHWKGIQIDVCAFGMGARVFERHFTLDRTLKGSDHPASLEPTGLQKLVRDLHACEAALGSAELRVLECEESARAKLRGA